MNQKANLSKQSSHEKRCFNLEGHLWHALLPKEDRPWEREKEKAKKKRKNWLSCHALEKIRLSLNKNQESKKNVEKMMKNCIHMNHFFSSCKESLFSLGNYVWDEKLPSFIIPSLMEKLSIVTLFEPDNFSFNNPTKDHPLHWGQRQRKISLKDYKRLNAWCWKKNLRN